MAIEIQTEQARAWVVLISECIFLSEKLDREMTAAEVLEMSQSTAVNL